MLGLLASRFADSGPAVHVAPATDFTIAGWPITNAILYGWIICVLTIAVLIYAARRITIRPTGGFIQYVEAGVEFVVGVVGGAFNDQKVARKYTAFFVTLFFFVLLHNWSGLIPGVGDGVVVHEHPLLRPMTADLNTTLAIGAVTMIFVYVASIREVGGIKKFIRHFFMGSPLNPMFFAIGILEMITDLTRALSLALRLFLNMAIGEIVIAVFVYLGGLLAPASVLSPITSLPFTLLELGVGALQAYVFVILSANYLAITVNSAHEHDNAHDLTESDVAETMIAATPPEGLKA